MSHRSCLANHDHGFTLIEILIVLLILAVVAGLITLSISTDERGTMQREAQRLTGALEYAADRARFRREIVGISALPDGRGWRFWTIPEDVRKNISWHAVADDAPLAVHRLPADLTLRPLYYAGQPLAADAIVPLLPSGRFEPYTLELRGTNWALRLNSDPLGRIFATLPETSGVMP
ncbi:MAG: prepilin-type N-terminal cleavage/methylation domain-containing protein [Burkholderiales bacterium]|jgi:type II secretion system protein H|nr:prepilin-type N-terminal cleavage/methylation domain-containing protein [Burkholderiales bacterium]